jgi:hypothetical protein
MLTSTNRCRNRQGPTTFRGPAALPGNVILYTLNPLSGFSSAKNRTLIPTSRPLAAGGLTIIPAVTAAWIEPAERHS